MADTEKVRENRLRRMASRQGIRVVKSRRRDPQAVDYGTYWLVDVEHNFTVAGDQWGMSLDDAQGWLTAGSG